MIRITASLLSAFRGKCCWRRLGKTHYGVQLLRVLSCTFCRVGPVSGDGGLHASTPQIEQLPGENVAGGVWRKLITGSNYSARGLSAGVVACTRLQHKSSNYFPHRGSAPQWLYVRFVGGYEPPRALCLRGSSLWSDGPAIAWRSGPQRITESRALRTKSRMRLV